MNQSAILSLRTPATASGRVEATPSPVLELAYCVYILTRGEGRDRTAELTWLRDLQERDPELIAAVRGFFEGSGKAPAYDLFLMACNFDFARDEGVDRFLDELPQLPGRLLEQFEQLVAAGDPPEAQGEKREGMGVQVDPELYDALKRRLERLTDPAEAERYGALLRRLWEHLAPFWRAGHDEVHAAAEAFLAKYRSSHDVLAALPPHHFTHFEAHAKQIRASQERGRIVVVPLLFASDGGFNLDLQEAHYIGFGVQSESIFQTTAARLTELAGRMKAFADPTRLILLGLIARFAHFQLTVTDLAHQLGVSQPTVSGHLKVLREAGLVTLERKGNKAFYQIDREAVEALLGGLMHELLES